ncbi:MAG: response regulator transcription factor [Chloroflexi bacterium]|nr:response regulator transcription factor [Chloroflexota bacterium]
MIDPGPLDDGAQLLVVAENLLARAGLTALLEDRGHTVLARTEGADLQPDIDRYQPDALVVDMGWDSGLMRARLGQIESDLPILAIAGEDDFQSLSVLLQTLRVFPQFALLLRQSSPDVIIAALDALAAGLSVIDPRLSALLGAVGGADDKSMPSPLTAREQEVLRHLARGLTNRAIAQELGITQHTVKFHVNAIMSKLEAQSRTEAVVRATQLGLIAL